MVNTAIISLSSPQPPEVQQCPAAGGLPVTAAGNGSAWTQLQGGGAVSCPRTTGSGHGQRLQAGHCLGANHLTPLTGTYMHTHICVCMCVCFRFVCVFVTGLFYAFVRRVPIVT